MEKDNHTDDVFGKHHHNIEIIMGAIASGFTSLIYTEYVKQMKPKIKPTKIVFVPPIRAVEELVNPKSELMTWVSENLIDLMLQDELFQKYKDAPELGIFDDDCIDVLKQAVTMYTQTRFMITVPQVFHIKFNLGDPTNLMIRESNEIDLFKRQPFTPDHYRYFVHETVLQMLVRALSIEREIDWLKDDHLINVPMRDDSVVTTMSNEAICPVIFDKEIIENKAVFDLLSFVTCVYFTKENDQYLVSSAPFLQTAIVDFKGINLDYKGY